VIASLGQTALSALLQRVTNSSGRTPSVPGPEIRATLSPRNADLVRDYVRHVGGDPGAYRKTLPAHFFPQWGFPLASKTLVGIPYPLMRVLNGGCRLEIRQPLPADEELLVTAQLEDIDDNGRRVVLRQKVVTGTKRAPEAVVGYFYAIVPLAAGKKVEDQSGKTKQEERKGSRVPDEASELAYWRIPANAGLDFALLTGDFNPVHWVRPYARAFGFKSTILHGFSTMARAVEGLNRALFAGDVNRLKSIDVKFTKPLVLPANLGLYLHGDQVYVGTAKGGPAYLVGNFTTVDRSVLHHGA
jgi:acyl dehydratase